jgi:hypothetical protein
MHDKPTAKFRRQHDELDRIAKSIEGKLADLQAGAGAADVRRLLAQYTGKLAIHLRIEDEALYPQLLEGKDAVLRERAATLKIGMGALDAEFQTFVRAWPSAASIESNPGEFCRQFARIIRAIGRRMAREEVELYALIDELKP